MYASSKLPKQAGILYVSFTIEENEIKSPIKSRVQPYESHHLFIKVTASSVARKAALPPSKSEIAPKRVQVRGSVSFKDKIKRHRITELERALGVI